MATTSVELQSAVCDLDAAFIRHANAGDAAALTTAYYADDAVLLAPGTPRLDGLQAIQAFWQGFIESGVKDVVLETTEVVEAGEYGYGIGKYACTMPLASDARLHDTGKYIVVYRRQADGGWKVIADQFNSDLPTG